MRDDTVNRQAAIDAAMKEVSDKRTYDFNAGATRAANNIKTLPSAQPEHRWVPCSERLPEEDAEVLVYLFDRPSPYIAWINDCCWFTEDFQVEKDNYPIAWMPLPEPYMEEGEG